MTTEGWRRILRRMDDGYQEYLTEMARLRAPEGYTWRLDVSLFPP
jgi:hypothetical protein